MRETGLPYWPYDPALRFEVPRRGGARAEPGDPDLQRRHDSNAPRRRGHAVRRERGGVVARSVRAAGCSSRCVTARPAPRPTAAGRYLLDTAKGRRPGRHRAVARTRPQLRLPPVLPLQPALGMPARAGEQPDRAGRAGRGTTDGVVSAAAREPGTRRAERATSRPSNLIRVMPAYREQPDGEQDTRSANPRVRGGTVHSRPAGAARARPARPARPVGQPRGEHPRLHRARIFILVPTGTPPALSLGAALLALVFGTLVGTAAVALVAIAGAETGQPTMVLLRGLLGARLSWLPTVLNVVQLLGWTTFELVTISTAMHQITPGVPRWVYVVIGGVLTTVLALRPLGWIRVLRRYVTVLVVIALVYLGVQLLRNPAAAARRTARGTASGSRSTRSSPPRCRSRRWLRTTRGTRPRCATVLWARSSATRSPRSSATASASSRC